MSTSNSSASTVPNTEVTLRHGFASLRSVAVLGLAAMQIGPGLALAGGYLILYTGDASWVAMLGALLSAAALAVGITAFSRRLVATGGLISYVGSTLGPVARAFTAAGYLCGILVSVAAVVTGVVIFTSSFLVQVGAHWAASATAQIVSAIILTVAAAALAYRGLDTSVRVSTLLTFAGIPFVLWVTAAAAINADFNFSPQFDFSGEAFSPAIIIPGITIAAANFVGFEGVTALAGETKDPRRNIPRLITLLLCLCGLSYIVMIWFQIPSLTSHIELLEEGESPTTILAHIGGVGFMAAPLDLLLAAATFAGLVATINYGSRIVATAAADGLIPRRLSTIHPKHRSPSAAIKFIAVIAVVLPALLQLVSSSPPLESSVYLYTLYAYFYLLPYVLAAGAAIVMLVREGTMNPLRLGVIAVGGIAWGYILWYGLTHRGEGIFAALPWVALAMTFALFLIFLWAHLRNPTAKSQMEDLL